MVSDANLANGYINNPFNVRNFGVNRIKLKRNGTSKPSKGYTPKFANGQYINTYSTVFQELEGDIGDKYVSLNLSGKTDTRYTRLKSSTVLSDQARTVHDLSLLQNLLASMCHLPQH